MARQVRRRRGNTSQHSTFVGAGAEITVDTDQHVLVVHDGVTQGGHRVAKANLTNTTGALVVSTSSVRITGESSYLLPISAGVSGQTLTRGSSDISYWATPSKVLTSRGGPYTIVNGLAVTFTHGLGGRPDLVSPEFQCVVAGGGYSIGDRVILESAEFDETSGATREIWSSWFNTTQAGVAFRTRVFAAVKTGGSSFQVTNTNFRLYIKCIRFL